MLGGAWAQIPAIKRAKQMGYHVTTCDYLPDNPGHKFADRYVNVSTVDKEAVLQYSVNEKIDGIIAYASDPSALTAAYVSEHLCLPGGSYNAVRLLSEKDLFRKFQKEHGFRAPPFFSITCVDDLKDISSRIEFPCVVKPVDSSGSKGVTKVDGLDQLEDAVVLAMSFSRCGRVIIEGYIPSPYCQLHGDGVVYGGKLLLAALGDQRFYHSVPIGTSMPSRINRELLTKAKREAARLIACSGFSCGGVNIEARVTAEGQVYIIEIGPRTGGNYIPQLMRLATGQDEITAVLQMAMGDPPSIEMPDHLDCCFQYIIGSRENGVFQDIYIDDYMRSKVVELFVHRKAGEWLTDYHNSSGVVGVALIRFHNCEEMETDIANIGQHIKVIVKKEP